MTDVNDNEITIDKKPTVGERLSHARQAKNLTVDEIASELRLTKQTIEFIENEQWSELHGRAYARGYFTNYVKLLGLPEDEFLAAFKSEYSVVEPSLLGTKYQDEISNKKIVWLPSLFFITIAVIGWFAYQQMQDTSDDVIEDIASLYPLTPADNESTIIDDQNTAPDTQLEMNALEQRVGSKPESFTNNDSVQENSEIVIAPPSDTKVLQESAQNVSTSEQMLDNTGVTSASAVLDLRFSDDCWVQVKDVDNNILLKKLMTKDDSIVLTGRTPLTVMLGRASVSEVRFNDKLFDPSAFTQKDVARFTLGAES